MENILLVSDVMIKERTSIHTNIDAKLMYPDIRAAQDMYILPILGSALFEKLQTLIDNNSISDNVNADYKNLLDKFICDALMYHTLSEMVTSTSYQFWNKGVMRKQNEDSDLPSMSELIDLSNKYKNRAEFYDNRLKLYLQQNTASKFPEYGKPGIGIDVIIPSQKVFDSPFYLGPDDDSINCKDFYWRNKPYGS
jgi:hypothetical protein